MAQLAVIGTGNMAEAILRGAIRKNIFDGKDIIASDVRTERLHQLAGELGFQAAASNAEAVRAATLVLLAVKPQNLPDVGAELAPVMTGQHTVMTILAGRTIQGVCSAFGGKPAVVRIMPNLPALIGQGVAAIAGGSDTPPAALEAAERIFATVGSVVRIEERLMDAVTAISGSGPGFVFLFMEAMIEAAIALGFDAQTATTLVLQTFLGAGRLACESGEDVVTLRKKVSSPGGTTLAGLEIFENSGLRDIFRRATARACERAGELSRM